MTEEAGIQPHAATWPLTITEIKCDGFGFSYRAELPVMLPELPE